MAAAFLSLQNGMRTGSLDMRTENEIRIRIVWPSDCEVIARLFQNNNVDEVTRYFHPYPLTRESAYVIACTAHQDRYYVIFCDDQMSGICMLRGWDEGYSVPSYGVLLDRRIWGQGIGRIVTQFAISEAEKLGCERMRLSVYANHAVARHLYESLGFVETARKPVDAGITNDEILIMHKMLKTQRTPQGGE